MRSKNYISPIIYVLEIEEESLICASDGTPDKTLTVEDDIVIDVHSKERGSFSGDDFGFSEDF